MNLMMSLARRYAGQPCLQIEGGRRHLYARIVTQTVIEHDNAQRVQKLPLVFVNTFDLRVEDGVWVNRQP